MNIDKKENLLDVVFFIIIALLISVVFNYSRVKFNVSFPASAASFAVGLAAFFFQGCIRHKKLITLYSKNYPYRRLKPYGILTSFVLFEAVLIWGLHTKQIIFSEENLFLISVVFAGVIVFYHAFVRMKISLRFLSLAIFVPTLAGGTALGLGSYFKILEFIEPVGKIGQIVLVNTLYWILFNLFIQMVCEEPAFRGYLVQRLLNKGENFAVCVSSAVFALWYVPFVMVQGMDIVNILLALSGNFIMGAMYALLFVKGRNLLTAILCHGIIDGLRASIFASGSSYGIKEYIHFLLPQSRVCLAAIWFSCMVIGLILITFIPRKSTNYV